MGTNRSSDFTQTVEQRSPCARTSLVRGDSPGAVRRALCACVLCALVLLLMASSALGAPEAPETAAASSVTASSATLNGVLNPHSESLVGYEFTYNSNGTCEGLASEPQPEAMVEALAVEAPVSGLEPDREYMSCLLATHLEGETPENTSGPTVSFKTLGLPPVVDGESASGVGSTAATLEAQVNPNNEATSFSFEYGTSEDLKGATTVAGSEALPAELGDRLATVPRLEGLTPGTTYFYRVVAQNAQSEEEKAPVLGVVQSFTTPPLPVTDPVSAVTARTATLNGHLVLSPVESFFSFAYNLGEGCLGGPVVAGEPPSGLGAGEQAVTAQVGELEPNAFYTACHQTQNGSGSQVGEPVQFKTLPAPASVDAESASGVTDTTANLESLINPNNQETVFRWRLSTEGQVGGSLEGELKTFPGAAPLSGFGDQPANVVATRLEPRTTYFYRVATENTATHEEETSGEVQAFTTLDEPLVTTGAAENLTRTQATLSGSVNPGGEPTSYHFVYVDAAHFQPGSEECASPPCAYEAGGKTPIVQAGSDYTDHETGPVPIRELKPATTYDYALVATNSLGTRFSANREFTTSPATPPLAATGPAVGVTQLSATLTGSVDTHGLPTNVYFEVFHADAATGPAALSPAVVGAAVGSVVPVSLTLSGGLQPASAYLYRVIATNADGTTEGAVLSFTTAAFPLPPAFVFAPGLAPLSFASIAELEAKEAKEHNTTTGGKALTRAQRLAKALKSCRKDKKKRMRASCRRQAHRKYAPAKKTRK